MLSLPSADKVIDTPYKMINVYTINTISSTKHLAQIDQEAPFVLVKR